MECGISIVTGCGTPRSVGTARMTSHTLALITKFTEK